MHDPLPVDLEGRLIVDSVHARLFGDEPPTRIGKHIILRRIGGGAMADVYLGWHEDLERSVAIKLVHPAAQASATEQRRLLREARALARLTHEHVIRVHDAGPHGDGVYIAMEYVKGTTLGNWQKGRPWGELLGVYLKAGRGLHAAHAVALDDDERPTSPDTEARSPARHGLVHRDFKPDNVLIGEDGRVRVADFGLAVPVDRLAAPAQVPTPAHSLDVRLTSSSAVLGTPLYISPEQLQGQPADARSDQFSFCVALYEALYDQHPFYVPHEARRDSGLPTGSQSPERTAPFQVLLEAVLKAPLRDPPRGKVPRRLFEVLARGLDRDPARRYPTMAELLAELERDPIRGRRWFFGGLGGLALVAGLYYAQTRPPAACVEVEREVADVWDDAHRAEVRAAFLATGVPYAAATFDSVDRTLRDYLDAWTHSREQACDATYVHGTQDRAEHGLNMACLDQRRTRARALVAELTRVDASTIAGAVDRAGALPRIEDCDDRVLLRQSCTIEPDDPASQQVRDALAAARAGEDAGRYADAEPLAAEAARLAGAHDVPALAAEAHFLHGRILTALSRPEAAREALLTALDLAEGAACEALAAELGTWVAKLVALSPSLDLQLGRDWSRYSFAKLPRIHDEPQRRADALSNRGLLRERREEAFAAAEQDYRDALKLREQDPERTKPLRAINYLNLGSVLRAQGRYPEALDATRRSLDLFREVYGEGHPNLWKPQFNLGTILTDSRDRSGAQEALQKALELARLAFGPENRKVLEAHNALAALLLDDGQAARARDQAQLARVICDQKFPADDPLCRDLRRQFAHSLEILGEPEEALRLREQVLAHVKPDDPVRGELHLELAASLIQLARWEPALDHAEAALQQFPSDDLASLDASLCRGEALLGLARPADAIDPLERAHTAWSAPEDEAPRARAAWALARSLRDAGRDPARARTLARATRQILAEDPDDPENIETLAAIDAWIRPCQGRP